LSEVIRYDNGNFEEFKVLKKICRNKIEGVDQAFATRKVYRLYSLPSCPYYKKQLNFYVH